MTDYFLHENALCESVSIGKGTRIWAFAHILPKAVIGSDCNICDGVFIENNVVVGNRVTINCGVQLWDGLTVEDDVFIGPNVTFTKDFVPRRKILPINLSKTIVRKGTYIGANATILSNLEIAAGAMVEAGSVVTRSVPPNAIVTGNPARVTGYVEKNEPKFTPLIYVNSKFDNFTCTSVRGVSLHELPFVEDMRGNLTVGEFEGTIPFIVKRYFLVFDVPSLKIRGEHAHHVCHQFLICIKGSCMVLIDDGTNRCDILLDRPNFGILVPAMTWCVQYKFTSDAMLLVFASEHYDSEDYIRNYTEYLSKVR